MCWVRDKLHMCDCMVCIAFQQHLDTLTWSNQQHTPTVEKKKNILLLKASHLQTVDADWKISDFPNTVGKITKPTSTFTSFSGLYVVNLPGF